MDNEVQMGPQEGDDGVRVGVSTTSTSKSYRNGLAGDQSLILSFCDEISIIVSTLYL